MGVINSKNFKMDQATSNTRESSTSSPCINTCTAGCSTRRRKGSSFTRSLSNLRYVITEKPKWKVFKKKEMVPLPPYRPANACPCGSDGPCKQKVTPNGVTIHYPQKKKKFSTFGLDRKFKTPKVQKGYFTRLLWKSLSRALPFQTRINFSLNLPPLPIYKVVNAYKAVKSIKPKLRKKLKSLKSLKSSKKEPKRITSTDFMFMPFM